MLYGVVDLSVGPRVAISTTRGKVWSHGSNNGLVGPGLRRIFDLRKVVVREDVPPVLKIWHAEGLLDVAELGTDLVSDGVEARGKVVGVHILEDGKDLSKVSQLDGMVEAMMRARETDDSHF